VHFVSASRRIAVPLALVAALFVLGAGSARASLLVADGANCNDYTYSQVFLPWADPANYTLAPGGSFETNNAKWSLIGASRVTSDNESFNVGDANDHSSLLIANGGTAISPAMCVGLGQPTARVFFKQVDGSTLAGLRVDVLFDDVTGETHAQYIGMLGARSAWTVSPQMAIVANLLPLLDVGTPVAFRFTALAGSFAIDDLYVDPWARP
jgi:hypothetical protein